MLAVLGGLGAALCWATTTLAAARASRLVGPQRVLAWVMFTGLVVVAPLLVVAGRPHGLGGREIGWLVVSGAGNVGGLFLTYAAQRIGKISIIAPITSTEGAIAALVAVADGEHLGLATAVLLAIIVAAVVVASRGEDETVPGAHTLRASIYAGFAALSFGASLFATGRVSQALPLAWALLPPRLLGVLVVTLPLAARRRLRVPRPVVPLVVLSGLCEVAGFASYSLGARHGIAIAAVLASQFAVFAIVGSYVVFHERLRAVQVSGIVTVLVCVAVLTAVRS
ncbi:MAG: EamA family transporter [Actinomycetota bacterium]